MISKRPTSEHPASSWSGPVLCDFESRSRANLKKCGGRRYWDHPSSEALCAVLYSPTSGEVAAWVPGMPAPRLGHAVAHNATMFDRFAAAASGWAVGVWSDSAQAARRAGLPGALDALAQRWLGRGKDKEGNRFTLSLSRPSRAKASRGDLPEITEDARARVLAYCANDVEVMADGWDRLRPWLDVDVEAGAVDRAINDRGIFLDLELVRATQTLLAEKQAQAVDRAARRLALAPANCKRMARSPAVFAELTGLPNAQAETLAEYVRVCDRDSLKVHPLVRARQALASIIPGKLVAMLDRVSDDSRLRDSHFYYGGHTGRWSQKGVQLHNLTRVEVHGGADTLRGLVRAAKRGDVGADLLAAAFPEAKKDRETLLFAALIRACLMAPPGRRLAVYDYAGIEARVNAWAAGDRVALDVFKGGGDPYCAMATTIFGRTITKEDKPQRQVGKQAELAGGYGMGPDKFRATCEKAGVDLDTQGVDPEDVIRAYRQLHAPIVRQWRACEDAFAGACEGRDVWAGPVLYAPIGDGVVCWLPSGRPLMYPGAKAKRVQRRAKSGSTFACWDLSYIGQRGWPEHVYGGKLVENNVQAMSRCLLADALVKLEAAGLDPVLHVHDEAVCEIDEGAADEGAAEMRRIMSEVPDWARGLPVKLDGFVERRYRK